MTPNDSHPDPPPTAPPEPQYEQSGGGLWVVGVVLLLSTGLAVFASFRFRTSEQYLTKEYDDFARRGAALTVHECVESVLEWRVECEAMKSLCDSNVERMVDACLSARDRSAYCASVGDSISDSHFAAAACETLGVSRSERAPWKFCGMAYRAVDYHCQSQGESPDVSAE